MKGLLLISGGYDSPVAGYLMQQKGVEVHALHFSYEPFTDNGPEIKSKTASDLLGFKSFTAINISKEIEEIAKKCSHKLYYVLSKRLMMKKAEELAKKLKYDFLITGENLAQVSSQTLSNLQSITEAVKIQIIRPLLTYEKIEILNLAKQIGTYETCSGPEVCDCLGPKHPATHSNTEEVSEEERKLNIII
ncbi:7-cyano-7-deazaguanine synthase [Candidatus Woesearchaeota archaeon]|nr:7-cyano-7-deazaguanine synthase [Candidatus Woesearchaeota archaeon]